MIRTTLLSFALVMLAACAAPSPAAPLDDPPVSEPTPRERPRSIEDAREQSRLDIDERACEAMGGSVRQAGMMGLYHCIVPYADGGKTCRSSDDCLGRCRTSNELTDFEAAPGSQFGQCEMNDSPFGCYGWVEDGAATPMRCVD